MGSKFVSHPCFISSGLPVGLCRKSHVQPSAVVGNSIQHAKTGALRKADPERAGPREQQPVLMLHVRYQPHTGLVAVPVSGGEALRTPSCSGTGACRQCTRIEARRFFGGHGSRWAWISAGASLQIAVEGPADADADSTLVDSDLTAVMREDRGAKGRGRSQGPVAWLNQVVGDFFSRMFKVQMPDVKTFRLPPVGRDAEWEARAQAQQRRDDEQKEAEQAWAAWRQTWGPPRKPASSSSSGTWGTASNPWGSSAWSPSSSWTASSSWSSSSSSSWTNGGSSWGTTSSSSSRRSSYSSDAEYRKWAEKLKQERAAYEAAQQAFKNAEKARAQAWEEAKQYHWNAYFERVRREEAEAEAETRKNWTDENVWNAYNSTWARERGSWGSRAQEERRRQRERNTRSGWGSSSSGRYTWGYSDYGRSDWGRRFDSETEEAFAGQPKFNRDPRFANTDLYQVLEIEARSAASAQVIKEAYRKMVRKWHPDVAEDAELAAVYIVDINFAYEILSNPASRAVYDKYGVSGLRSQFGF